VSVGLIRLIGNSFAGSGSDVVNIQAYSSGTTIDEIQSRGNRMSGLSGAYLRVPTGHTIALFDTAGDRKVGGGRMINDVGGHGVASVIAATAADSSSASSLGSLKNVVEVFDARGTSLGYVPLYETFAPTQDPDASRERP